MAAFAALWISVVSLTMAVAMLIHRPVLTDITIVFVLYFGAPGAMCLAGLVLWAHRKDDGRDPGVRARRLQAKVGISLAVLSAAIVYSLIISADRIIHG